MGSFAPCDHEVRAPDFTTPAGAGDDHRSAWETAAHWLWLALAIGVFVRIGFIERDPGRNNVYLKVFVPAAEAFQRGRELYLEPDGWPSGFRYPPISAALFVPFAQCGARLGSLLWRALAFGLLFWALKLSFRRGFPFAMRSRARAFTLVVVALLGIGSLNNGQSNAHILALLLLAALGGLGGRDAGPAAAVAGCVALKVYPLAYGGVLGVLRPRHGVWLALMVVALATAPFALQDPAYVARQYTALWQVLRTEDRTTGDLIHAYRDLRLVAASFGVTTPQSVFGILQVVGGAAIVGVCLALRRAGARAALVSEYAFSLTMCWFMLLGPATEKVTYVILAPSLAWTLLAALRQPRPAMRMAMWAALALAMLALLPLDVPRDARPVWLWCLLPYSAVILSAVLAVRAAGDLRSLRRGSRADPRG